MKTKNNFNIKELLEENRSKFLEITNTEEKIKFLENILIENYGPFMLKYKSKEICALKEYQYDELPSPTFKFGKRKVIYTSYLAKHIYNQNKNILENN